MSEEDSTYEERVIDGALGALIGDDDVKAALTSYIKRLRKEYRKQAEVIKVQAATISQAQKLLKELETLVDNTAI